MAVATPERADARPEAVATAAPARTWGALAGGVVAVLLLRASRCSSAWPTCRSPTS